MAIFSLYKKGRYGYFHITSNNFNSVDEAEEFYKKEFGYKKIQVPCVTSVNDFKIWKIKKI